MSDQAHAVVFYFAAPSIVLFALLWIRIEVFGHLDTADFFRRRPKTQGRRFFFVPYYTDEPLFTWRSKWLWWRRVELLVHGHEHETNAPVYLLRVGRSEMLLRTLELDDAADVFFRMMAVAEWRLKDGRARIKGGTLGDRTMKWPPWALEALGYALAPYRRRIGDAGLR